MFITFEGIEGSGKSTQIRHLAAFLADRGSECVVTREPGGTELGQRIRSLLLDPASKGLAPAAELLLYNADRVQHATDVIEPNLRAGKIVLCDRIFDATVVYQGFGRGLERRLIARLHRLFLDDLTPDLTFLLDLNPEQGLSRAWRRIRRASSETAESRFEAEAMAFHQKIREGYLVLAGAQPDRIRVVDAARPEELVREDIIRQTERFIAEKGYAGATGIEEDTV